MKKVDFIIVGQGLAGTLLSWFLIKNKKSFIIVDKKNESTASQVAAGIIHPVTGRRIVKTWMAEELLGEAEGTFKEIEEYFGVKIFYPLPVLELLSSPKEYNDWLARSGEKELSSFIGNVNEGVQYDGYLHPYFKSITVNRSSRIDIQMLLNTFRKYLKENEWLLEEKFGRGNLRLTETGVEYNTCIADKIIFCEGVETMNNPFWNHLPFLPSKGEILTIKAEMELHHILNSKIFILPLGNKLFRVGSTYVWNIDNILPTVEAKDFLINQVKSILKVPFDVVDHKAGIRPTVKNRRPFLGLHPEHSQIGIFNGLGTKGCLLAPYFAKHLAGFLIGENKLMSEVDVRKLKG